MDDPFEELVVVSKKKHDGLLKIRKVFVACCAVSCVFAAFNVGSMWAYGKEYRKLQDFRRELNDTRREQNYTTEKLVQAWGNVQDDMKLVITWAEYIKQRDDVSKYNRENAPETLVVRIKK